MTSSPQPKSSKLDDVISPVISPCPYFNSCGGCDFLDLDENFYRQVKKNLLKENISDDSWIWVGPHSRRRINLQISNKNQIGFFSRKSNQLVEIENCFVAEAEISNLILPLKKFLTHQEQNIFTNVSITLFDNGLDVVFGTKKELNFAQIQKLLAFAKSQNLNISYKIQNHVTPVFMARQNQIFYSNFKISLNSEVFIQATKSGLNSIITVIRNFLSQQKTSLNVADIYAGFGAYSFAIIDLAKSVSAFEGSAKMVDLINKNAAANGFGAKLKAETCDLFSNPISYRNLNKFDLAIINPPRNGASPQVKEISQSKLNYVIYVSCNPESFKRDAKILIDSQFKIIKLIALDQFYSSKHLELISIFEKYEKN